MPPSPDALQPADPGPSTPPRLQRTVSAATTALMEKISEGYADGEPAQLAAEAREAFLLSTGRVHEGDRSFDDRMAQFMEWFLLDRPLPPGSQTPAQRWAAEYGPALEPAERTLLLALLTSHRSLFLMQDRDDSKRLVVDDLVQGMRWAVTAPGGLPGVEPGDVFEGRLLGHGGEVHFTAAFCYHPREAAQRIRSHTEHVRDRRLQAGPSLLDELMSLRLAYDRAEGAPVTSIYRFGR